MRGAVALLPGNAEYDRVARCTEHAVFPYGATNDSDPSGYRVGLPRCDRSFIGLYANQQRLHRPVCTCSPTTLITVGAARIATAVVQRQSKAAMIGDHNSCRLHFVVRRTYRELF